MCRIIWSAVLLFSCLLTRGLGSAMARPLEQVVYYQSVGPNGDSLLLSGKVSVPRGKQPKGLILLPHYTISANKEAPSQYTSYEAKKFRDEYVLVMPDYIGYGATAELFHPYLQGSLTAQNCVDMLFASRSTIDSLCPGAYTDSIYIVGFSQGAATALWILRLLEERYSDRIHVKACAAGSGPYDVAATYDVAVSENKVGMPMVVPMLIMGTSEAYNLHLRPEDFFSLALNKVYEKYIVSKKYTVSSLYSLMSNHRVDYWMTAAGMDKSQPETKRMYEGLLRSSLVHYPLDNSAEEAVICPSWRPKAPVYIFHSTADDIVTFRCAEHLRRCWSDLPNVTYDFGNYGGHLRSLYTFFPRAYSRIRSAANPSAGQSMKGTSK